MSEVVFSGAAQIGTAAAGTTTGVSGGSGIAALFDANQFTWYTGPDLSTDWAGVDLGATAVATGVRMSPRGGYEDLAIGGVFQGSNDGTFVTWTTLFTIASRPRSGLLLNTYTFSSTTPYRYYRYLSATNGNLNIADIEFYGQFSSGITAQCSPVKFSVPGGIYDLPVVVNLSTTTTNAQIYYTTDGSTPSATNGTGITGPITVNSSVTVKAVAVASGFTNSRVTSQPYAIGGQIISTNQWVDTSGYPIQSMNPSHLFDPVSNQWYRYGFTMDGSCLVTTLGAQNGTQGITVYSSPDLRNWTYQGMAVAAPATQANNWTSSTYRPHVFYNVANNNYVMWNRYFSTFGIWTSSTPTGPFALQSNPASLDGGFATGQDLDMLLDPADGVSVYLFYATSKSSINYYGVTKLNSSYTGTDGVNQNYVVQSSHAFNTFGTAFEGFCVWYFGGVYYWMANQSDGWTPFNTYYCTATSPLGTFAWVGSPFAKASGLPNGGFSNGIGASTSVGITGNNAYGSQAVNMVKIPGRVNAYLWVSDQYQIINNGNPGTFAPYTVLALPATHPVPGQLTLSYNNSWSFDTQWTSLPGSKPLPSTALIISSSPGANSLSWMNNEPNPYALYVDRGLDSSFASAVCFPLPQGATFFVDTALGAANAYHYRVRTVNSSGSAFSKTVTVTGTAYPENSAAREVETIIEPGPAKFFSTVDRSASPGDESVFFYSAIRKTALAKYRI